MTKAIVESVIGADYFILNGISRPKSYEAIGVRLLDSKKGVKIIPIQRDDITLQNTILFDEYLINGRIPITQEECISLLNEIMFKTGGGDGGNNGSSNNAIIPYGEILTLKTLPSDNNEFRAAGDYCIGIIGNVKFEGIYKAGNPDPMQLSSYEIFTQQIFK